MTPAGRVLAAARREMARRMALRGVLAARTTESDGLHVRHHQEGVAHSKERGAVDNDAVE